LTLSGESSKMWHRRIGKRPFPIRGQIDTEEVQFTTTSWT